MSDTDQKIDETLAQVRTAPLGLDAMADLLRRYAAHVGLEELELDQDNAVEITVDGNLDVSLIAMPHLSSLFAAATVASDTATDGNLARRLLQANMSWSLTQGGIFAMLPGRDDPMLCRLIVLASHEIEDLDRELASFVGHVTEWRNQIDEFGDDVDDDQSGNDARPNDEHLLRV